MPTYNTTCPDATQTPGDFPPQANANFQVLLDEINRDHIFNATPAPGDNSGSHRQITLTNQAPIVSLPPATNGVIYLNSSLPVHFNGSQQAVLARASAFITWDPSGVAQGTPFNATVALFSAGIYTVTFAAPLPSMNVAYALSVIQSGTSVRVVSPVVYGGASSVASWRVSFQSGTSVFTSFDRASLIIFGG